MDLRFLYHRVLFYPFGTLSSSNSKFVITIKVGRANVIISYLVTYEIVKASIGSSRWELSHAFVSFLW